jgi:tetratricopeptide (TPR) repeat protein
MYFWRMSAAPPEYRQKTPASQQALVRETEFAFKQAFAFCPYSPEAVMRYVTFLFQLAGAQEAANRPDLAVHYFEDALVVVTTCQKLDPGNSQLGDLIKTIQTYKAHDQQAEAPSALTGLLTQAVTAMQAKQTNNAIALFAQAIAIPNINVQEVQAVTLAAQQLRDYGLLEAALRKMVSLVPNEPEPRCDLAAVEAITGRAAESLAELKVSLDLSAKRRAQNPGAPNLVETVRNDPRFASLRSSPEFQKLTVPQ